MARSPVWIAWERQRRTTELAKALGIDLVRFEYNGPYLLRIVVVVFQTVSTLLWRRPSVLVVQNPSVVLASLAVFFRKLLGYRTVVDRHSNFKFDSMDSKDLQFRVFHFLSRYSVRGADLTVVTNEYLADVVREWGGRAIVLPDRIPEMEYDETRDLGTGHHVLFVNTFSTDEPVEEVLEAGRLLGPRISIHITGNVQKAAPGLIDGAAENVFFTGFIPDREYASLMASVDLVLTLTTQAHTMQCGAYEAVSLGKPLIFADSREMREYFHKGIVLTEPNGKAIADSISSAVENYEQLVRESRELKEEIAVSWTEKFRSLQEEVYGSASQDRDVR